MKELTIEEIKKELDAGHEVELECVDEKGFLSDAADTLRCWREVVLSLDKIIVNSRSSSDNALFLHNARGTYIVDSALKYFRIKRPTPTFDDLIDVTVQGVKDNVLIINHFDKDAISAISPTNSRISFEEWRSNSTDEEIIGAINLINSLYTETFVMEDISSFLKITEGIQSIVLANGCDITHRVYFDDSSLRLRDGWGDSITLTFEIIKGATVTQRKGNK